MNYLFTGLLLGAALYLLVAPETRRPKPALPWEGVELQYWEYGTLIGSKSIRPDDLGYKFTVSNMPPKESILYDPKQKEPTHECVLRIAR